MPSYIHVHVYTQIHLYAYTCILTYTCACVYVYMCICTDRYACAHPYILVNPHTSSTLVLFSHFPDEDTEVWKE